MINGSVSYFTGVSVRSLCICLSYQRVKVFSETCSILSYFILGARFAHFGTSAALNPKNPNSLSWIRNPPNQTGRMSNSNRPIPTVHFAAAPFCAIAPSLVTLVYLLLLLPFSTRRMGNEQCTTPSHNCSISVMRTIRQHLPSSLSFVSPWSEFHFIFTKQN